jgi:2-dehydropantoate 2-reductase
MKIGVVGCGALGSYYGAMLCRAGHEVHFLLRSDFAVVRERGVTIETGGHSFNVRPNAANAAEQIGICELVLIGLKTTANDQFRKLLPPMVGPGTIVLTLQNGLGNEEALANIFPAGQVMGGLCFVCLNRVEPGRIVHTDRGFVLVGEFANSGAVRAAAIAALFEQAGVKCRTSENLAAAHWEKLVWNVPFNGLGVAGVAGLDAMKTGVVPVALPRRNCLATDELLADAQWTGLVRGLMAEVIGVARKLGHPIPETLADQMIQRTRTMGAYRASTLIDFERGQPLELESLFREPLRQARECGANVPLLANLCAVLGELDRRRGGLFRG